MTQTKLRWIKLIDVLYLYFSLERVQSVWLFGAQIIKVQHKVVSVHIHQGIAVESMQQKQSRN